MAGHVIEPGMPPSRDEVRLHLERVLSSPHFRNSRRCQTLLRYAVERALEGHPEGLKERIIGQAVFDRDAGYDTNQDAVVRNAAAEVRKRLAQYYQEVESSEAIRIEMPSGGYVPEFHSATAPPPPAIKDALPKRLNWPAVIAAVIVTTVATTLSAIAIAGWLSSTGGGSTPAAELDQFWAPHLASAAPVQICIGQSRYSYFPGRLGELPSKEQIPVSEMLPMRDRFLWFGDAVSMADISGYFSQHRKLFKIRGALVTPYSELRGNPIVLIGAFNNDWTLRLTDGMRFSLSNDEASNVRGVRDREKGTGLAWQVARSTSGWKADEDYALVTRFFDPHTEQVVVSAGGITHFGTMAAGDFLSNPAYFRSALTGAPADWGKKNMQIVLEIRVLEGTPGPPRVVAAHFW